MQRMIWRFAFCFLLTTGLLAQGSPPAPRPGPLTLKNAVDFAARNYPDIRAALAEISESESAIDAAKTAYLPEAILRFEVNRATRNNVFGLIFPNGAFPAISGPVLEEATIQSTFGSAGGLFFSWEPFDFGLRKAQVGVAEAERLQAEVGRAVTEYEVSLAVVSAYLQVMANRQAVAAAQATVERMEVFAKIVGVLAQNQLRPGADESRALAELAQARTEAIRAEEQAQIALTNLAEKMGLAGTSIQLQPGPLLRDPPGPPGATASMDRHPLARAQQAEIAVVEARQRALETQWRPKFELQSAVYGRGTGARVDGTFEGGAHGLLPSHGNWAVGFAVSFNLFDYKRNRIRKEIEGHRIEREKAIEERVVQQLRGEAARSQIALEAARKIASNTPLELEAARVLETQAQARYRTGLGTVLEVADAQRLLRQAEVDDRLARLGIWRALFALAAVQGEMEELLDAASKTEGEQQKCG